MRKPVLISFSLLLLLLPAIGKEPDKSSKKDNSQLGGAMPPPDWRPDDFDPDKYFIRDTEIKALKKSVDILINIDYQRHKKLIDDTWFYKIKGEQLSAIEKTLHSEKDPNSPFRDPAPPPEFKDKAK
ncbi:MAG: hypothetical protein K8F91_22775 [Candidatus Obscuribacterales bacterium]|nr:hypothetical protein [Candidatus Obscuribacterales bacterium]